MVTPNTPRIANLTERAARRERVSRSVSALALLCALLWSSAAQATPADTVGLGTRNISLGGAVTADVEDVGANYYNPAGIVRGPGIRLSLNYRNLLSRLEINGNDSNVENIGGITLGIVAPLQIGDFRFGFGLGVHLPDQRLSRTRSTINTRPRWERWDTRPHKVFLSTNIAFRPVDWLLFGIGITFQSPSDLQIQLDGEASALNATRTRLRHAFAGDLTSVRYPQVGVQLVPSEALSIGFSWRGELTLTNKLSADVDGDVTLGSTRLPLLFQLLTESVSTFMPQQITIGVAHRVADNRVRWSVDLTWMDWSGHPSLVPSEQISIMLESGGLDLGLPDEIRGRDPIPLGLRDTVVPRIGIEVDALQTDSYLFRARAGYVYERTPFPIQRGITNFVDSDRHTLSAGLGLRLTDLRPTIPGYLQFDMFFQYSHLPERLHVKDSLVDLVGDYRAGGQQFGLGVSAEIVFE